jgi:hypothetical protein
MVNSAEVRFGVCPSSSDPLCSRSYRCGRGVEDDLVGWVSRNFLPGSGRPGPRDEALLQKCSDIFQPSSSAERYCPKCGLKLILTPEIPQLGSCECGRKYHEDDLTHVFCSTCGGPVSIAETIKAEYRKQKEIEKLFSAIPALQQRGYLPR